MTSRPMKPSVHENIIEVVKKYVCIAFGLTLLGIGLLLFGIAGLANYDKSLSGPPYFISGIVVGCLEVLSALLCIRILQTARQMSHDELEKGSLTPYISSQIRFSVCSVIVSMLGILLGLVGGYSRVLSRNQSEGVNKFLAAVIVIGCGIAFCFEMYALYVANSFDQYLRPESSLTSRLQYRPGQGNGYLQKNLNTYIENVNGSLRQQQQQQQASTVLLQEETTYESLLDKPTKQQQQQQQQQQEQQQHATQEHESVDLVVPEADTEDAQDVKQPLLPDNKNNAVTMDSKA